LRPISRSDSSLYLRQAFSTELRAASAVLLMIWGMAAGTAPRLPQFCRRRVVLFGFAWIYPGRAGIDRKRIERSMMTVLLSQFVASLQSPVRCYFCLVLVAANLVSLPHFWAGLLARMAQACSYRRYTATLAVTVWYLRYGMPGSGGAAAVRDTALPRFLAYPLLLGRRSGKSLLPYLAAVAWASFFFQARNADAGWDNVIGILPAQALLMGLLVVRFCKSSPDDRAQGRLAMTAPHSHS
jgi:hypothetical protein